jgi:hypothetical protein
VCKISIDFTSGHYIGHILNNTENNPGMEFLFVSPYIYKLMFNLCYNTCCMIDLVNSLVDLIGEMNALMSFKTYTTSLSHDLNNLNSISPLANLSELLQYMALSSWLYRLELAWSHDLIPCNAAKHKLFRLYDTILDPHIIATSSTAKANVHILFRTDERMLTYVSIFEWIPSGDKHVVNLGLLLDDEQAAEWRSPGGGGNEASIACLTVSELYSQLN